MDIVGEEVGLIPAWAGKTGRRQAWYLVWWAHPRVGGENPSDASAFEDVVGSSPRGRGKLALDEAEAQAMRLIPAWAGKTHG